MPRITQSTFQKSWIASAVLFLIIGSITLFTLYIPFLETVNNPDIDGTLTVLDLAVLSLGDFRLEFFLGDLKITILDILDMTFLTVLITLVIPAYYYRKDNSWKEKVDENLPNLLREISDAQKVGLPLPRAIVEASKRQYGPLTEELQIMASKISWGIPFAIGLREMQQSIQTPLFDRTSVLILEAEKAGGQTDEIFDSAYIHVSELLGLKRERLGAMSPYRWIIIVSFVVFALVIVLLLNSFFIQLAIQGAEIEEAGVNSGFGGLPLHLAALQLLFFHLLIIEGFFSGLIAAKMSTGFYSKGLFNSILLLTAGWVIFKLGAIFV